MDLYSAFKSEDTEAFIIYDDTTNPCFPYFLPGLKFKLRQYVCLILWPWPFDLTPGSQVTLYKDNFLINFGLSKAFHY